jgi:hypothetical protein
MRYLKIFAILSALLLPAIATAQRSYPIVCQGFAGCDISGSWRHSTADVGQAVWTFTSIGGNRYDAQEIGLGNATGRAVLDGNRLRIDWKTGIYSGYYEWYLGPDCTSGNGKLVFFSGGKGSHDSSLMRLK